MGRWSFMVVFIFAFCVPPYCIVVAETVELKLYSNSSNVIVKLVTPVNNQNPSSNQGRKIFPSHSTQKISAENPLLILVPQEPVFTEFLSWNENHTNVSGFCIEVFNNALEVMGQTDFPYKFVPFNGTSYDHMIRQIDGDKAIGGAVGDITILANRSELVDFTVSYMASGVALIVLGKDETQSVWMFFRPFSKEIWSAMIATLIYTGFIVWFLEHGGNSEFRGPWPQQFITTVWFIFSTMFFAHRERITRGYSRIVIMVWLFLILVMVSSFQASLSSMLTVRKLTTEVRDVNYLLVNQKTVGCAYDSFIYEFLKNVMKFHPTKIKKIKDENGFDEALRNKSIDAAFIETPYLRVFLEKYPDNWKITKRLYGVGGLAFAFKKGSPYTSNFSKAILSLTERNKIEEMEQYILHKSSENWNPSTKVGETGLTLENFWVLFVFSAGTSTVILIIFIIQLVQQFRHQSDDSRAASRESDNSSLGQLLSFVKYWNEGNPKIIVFPNSEHRSQDNDVAGIVQNDIPRTLEQS